jgi:post-segregation antitoxin (ccd killing protein)
MKTKATILIDQEVLEKAHAMGINVSKACENALIILTDHSAKAYTKIGKGEK